MKSLRKSGAVLACLLLAVGIAAVAVVALHGTARAAVTYTVDRTTDNNPAGGGEGAGNAGDLRYCLERALVDPDPDRTINFVIPNGPPPTVQTITLAAEPAPALPVINQPITFDGYTQDGAFRATDGTPATIMIQVDCAGQSSCLNFTTGADESRVSGLSIGNAGAAAIQVSGANGVQVDGNYFGVRADGSAFTNPVGVQITGAGTGTLVGGVSAGERNIISANSIAGILMSNTPDPGNTVSGNYIGLGPDGNTPVGNGDGVLIQGLGFNTIGGDTPGERNVISGNDGTGVHLTASAANMIQGNYIGTDAGGTLDRGNTDNGVWLELSSEGNNIGVYNPNTGEGNVISGNGPGNDGSGVFIDSSSNNAVLGNYIGTEASGTDPLGNEGNGILVKDCGETTFIGGEAEQGLRNVISGNGSNGVEISNSSGCFVRGNLIGTDKNGAGDDTLGNAEDGVYLSGASSSNFIGTMGVTLPAPGLGAIPIPAWGLMNVISGNGFCGVNVAGGSDNWIGGNYIGTEADGVGPRGNMMGVNLAGTGNCTVGGSVWDRNVISGNTLFGVLVDGGSGNLVQGNFIGTDANGVDPVSLTAFGVAVLSNSTGNTIGGASPDFRNVISGNMVGVLLSAGSNVNFVEGNYIGTDVTGTKALPNSDNGVQIDGGAYANTVGGSSAAANLVCNNGNNGVSVESGAGCMISHNQIRNNAETGVVIWDKDSFYDQISANSIYGNGKLGIDLGGDGVTPNDGNNDNPNKPNRGFNFPVIPSASLQGGTVSVVGTAPPNSIVELFNAGPVADPSGHGQGLESLATVQADAAGNFSAGISGLSKGATLSATATSNEAFVPGAFKASGSLGNSAIPPGNTSEFSANVTVGAPSLSVAKSADPLTAAPGDTVTYTIVVANNGNGIAKNTTLADEIPAKTSVVPGSVACTDAGAKIESESPVKVTGITVPAGGSVTVTFKVRIDQTAEVGTVIKNRAVVTYPDPVYSTDPAHPGEDGTTDVVVQSSKALGSRSWFIAEGSTAAGFDTWILLQNPGGETAHVSVKFSTDGGPSAPLPLEIPSRSRLTLRVSDYLPDTWGVSTIVESDVPVVAERSLYWNKNSVGDTGTPGAPQPFEMKGGHSNLGVPREQLATTGESPTGGRAHYFPEGATAGGFDTWILLVNPNEQDAAANVTLMTEKGPVAQRQVPVKALSRQTVHLDEYLPDAFQVATEVTSNLPLVAERSTYWDPDEANLEPCRMRGGHSNAGSPAPQKNWYLAEGATGGGFETYVLLQNPGDSQARVTTTFMGEKGVLNRTETTMPPHTRATIKVSDYAPDNLQVSTSVASDQPVVAERSTYWDKRAARQPYEMRDGHSTVGATKTSPTWMVPEGSTGGGFDSFVLIANTENSPAGVTLTFMTQKSAGNPVSITIPAASRYTVRVSDYAPDEFQVSTFVTSSSQLVVERAMYWDKREKAGHPFDIRPYEMMGGSSSSAVDP